MNLKKTISLLLVICMVLSFFPAAAFADYYDDAEIIEEISEEALDAGESGVEATYDELGTVEEENGWLFTEVIEEAEEVEEAEENPVSEEPENDDAGAEAPAEEPEDEIDADLDLNEVFYVPKPVDMAQILYVTGDYVGQAEIFTNLATALNEAGGNHIENGTDYGKLDTYVRLINIAVLTQDVDLNGKNITIDLNDQSLTLNNTITGGPVTITGTGTISGFNQISNPQFAEGYSINANGQVRYTESVTVTFDPDNGSATTSDKIAKGALATKPAQDPEKAGYTFAGWFAGNGTEWNFSNPVNTDMTLTARWTPTEYTITYELNGGEVATANPATYTIESEAITLENPTKADMVFSGWYTDEGLQNEFTYIKGTTIGNLTLYAKWIDAVAKIGETLYPTLEAAVNAVQTNETITLLASFDATGYTLKLPDGVTGVTVRGESEENYVVITDMTGMNASNNGLTFENIKFDRKSVTLAIRGKSITFNHCDFIARDGGVNLTTLNDAEDIVFSYCNFQGKSYGSGYLIRNPSVTNLTFDHCTLENGWAALYYGFLKGNVIVKDTTIDVYAYVFHTGGDVANQVNYHFENDTLSGWFSYGQDVTSAEFENCYFKVNPAAYANYIKPYGDTVFEECDFDNGMKVEVAEAAVNAKFEECTLVDGESRELITVYNCASIKDSDSKGTMSAPAAKIGDTYYYADIDNPDLSVAVAAAKAAGYAETVFYADPTAELQIQDPKKVGDNHQDGTWGVKAASESIELDKTTLTLKTGEEATLTAAVDPDTVGAIWSSSNTEVASVDENGKVTAVAVGTATITAKPADGTNIKAECAITVTADGAVARIGNNTYESLGAAVAAAEDGDTVTLLANVTLSTALTMDGVNKYGVVINKSITLDGDNHTITGNTNRTIGIMGESSDNKIDVTVKNLTIRNAQADGGAIFTRGNLNSLTLDNVNLFMTGSNYTQPLTISGNPQNNTPDVTITNCQFESNPNCNNGYAIINWVPAKFVISESTIKGWACLYTKPGSNGTSYSVDSSQLISANHNAGEWNSFGLIVLEDKATVSVTNTEIDVSGTSNTQAIVTFSEYWANQSGTTTVGSTATLGEGNTITMVDDAVFVKHAANDGDTGGTIVISGGHFDKAVPAQYVKTGLIPTTDTGDHPYTVGEGWKITPHANDGTASTGDIQCVARGESLPLELNYFTNDPLAFTGWNTMADGSGTSYADGETITPTSDMDLYAQWGEAVAKLTIDYVDPDDEAYNYSFDLYYATFEEAVAAANENVDTNFIGTITILKNFSISDTKTSENDRIVIKAPVTIDFDAYTMTVPGSLEPTSNWAALYIDADTTVKATTGGIDCLDNGSDPGVYTFNVRNNAKLTIESGNYHGGGTIAQAQLGTVEILGGTFTATAFSDSHGMNFVFNCVDSAYAAHTASFDIKGGTFVGFDPQDNKAEGEHTRFTSANYVALDPDGDGTFVVQKGYVVTFAADGGTPAPEAQRVADGGKATKPDPAPAKANAVFKEWQLNDSMYNFDTVLTGDITLKAVYDSAVASVTHIDGETTTVTYFATLEAANAASKSGDTIELLADVEVKSRIDLKSNVTLDGDGHTISVGGNAFKPGLGDNGATNIIAASDSVEGYTIKNVTLTSFSKEYDQDVVVGNILGLGGPGTVENVTIRQYTTRNKGADAINTNNKGTVTFKGTNTFYLGEKVWSPISLNTNADTNKVIFAEGASLVIKEDLRAKPQAMVRTHGWIDSEGNPRITGAENIGYVSVYEKAIGVYAERSGFESKDSALIGNATTSGTLYNFKVGETYFKNFADAAAFAGTTGTVEMFAAPAEGDSYTLTETNNSLKVVKHGHEPVILTEGAFAVVQTEETVGEQTITTYRRMSAVASITTGETTKYFATLAAAIEAVPAGSTETTIKILVDNASTGRDNRNEAPSVLTGQNVVIDMNEKTLVGALNVKDGGSLKLTNGTLKNVGGQGVNVHAMSGTTSFTLDASATITAAYGIILREAAENATSTINVDGTVNGNVWVIGIVNAGDNTINVTGTITNNADEDVGLALQGLATVNVSGNAQITGKTGIEVRGGTLNVTGGTITGTDYPTAAVGNNNGTTSKGAGIAVSRYDINDLTLNITGGTITGYTPLFITNTAETSNEALTLSVTGGTFQAINDGEDAVVVKDESAVPGFIIGGVYSSEPDDSYIKIGYVAEYDDETQPEGWPYCFRIKEAKQYALSVSANNDDWGHVTGADKYYENQDVTVTAIPEDGYEFVAWYSGTKRVSGDATYTFSMPAKLYKLQAQFVRSSEEHKTVILDITGGEFTLKIGDKDPEIMYMHYHEDAEVGPKYVVTYVPAEGESFLYWKNGANKVLSTNKSFAFSLSTDLQLIAVTSSSTTRVTEVTFTNISGNTLSAKSYAADTVIAGKITVPDAPSYVGGTFEGWQIGETVYATVEATQQALYDMITDDDAPANIQVLPKYTVAEDVALNIYVGTVDGEGTFTPLQEEPVQSDKLTVGYADVQLVGCEKTDDGYAYKIGDKTYYVRYWVRGGNDYTEAAALSMTDSVKLRLTDSSDVNLYVVLAEDAVEAEPLVTVQSFYSTTTDGVKQIIFISGYTVPEGYSVVERGAFRSTSPNHLTIEGATSENGVTKRTSTGMAQGTLTWTNNLKSAASQSTTFYFRGYMTVRNNADGDLKTIYTDIVSGNWDSLNPNQ